MSTNLSGPRLATMFSPGAEERAVEVQESSPVVYIVDDDVSVREALELIVQSAGWQPETFASAEAFLLRGKSAAPCCLILDVGLPGLDGLELQGLLAADQGHMPIIFITGHGDVPLTVKAMRAGAIDFLTKPFDGETLLGSIRQALACSQATLDKARAVGNVWRRHALLSRREREVMALVVCGFLNKQVGGELGISEITVKAHRGKVMLKMEAGSLAELVNMGAILDLPAAQTR